MARVGREERLVRRWHYRPAIERVGRIAPPRVADGRLGWVQQVSDRPESVAGTDTQYRVGVPSSTSAIAEL
jgi:hypothetical protein